MDYKKLTQKTQYFSFPSFSQQAGREAETTRFNLNRYGSGSKTLNKMAYR
jgi:hypothetical protein